jgi:hypothetical protein
LIEKSDKSAALLPAAPSSPPCLNSDACAVRTEQGILRHDEQSRLGLSADISLDSSLVGPFMSICRMIS